MPDSQTSNTYLFYYTLCCVAGISEHYRYLLLPAAMFGSSRVVDRQCMMHRVHHRR